MIEEREFLEIDGVIYIQMAKYTKKYCISKGSFSTTLNKGNYDLKVIKLGERCILIEDKAPKKRKGKNDKNND